MGLSKCSCILTGLFVGGENGGAEQVWLHSHMTVGGEGEGAEEVQLHSCMTVSL